MAGKEIMKFRRAYSPQRRDQARFIPPFAGKPRHDDQVIHPVRMHQR